MIRNASALQWSRPATPSILAALTPARWLTWGKPRPKYNAAMVQISIMYRVQGYCPFCRSGGIGFRRCSDGTTIVLMCEECEALWMDPARRDVDDLVFPAPSGYEVPGMTCSIGDDVGVAGWATREQIARLGWEGYIASEVPQRE